MGLKNSGGGGGEIVQVQGGHIMRATGRKDRHSKVFTAKGPRDRRVRLSAHTAIQFYDVQDRLGYDRPSKAVDWLMNKAKASIDKLAELPPWDPMAGTSNTVDESVKSTEIPVGDHTGSTSFQLHNNPTNVGFGSEGVGSHSFGCHDSMKSFFPTTSEDNQMSFQSYPHGLISRGGSQNQDLCLSLHSLQDPGVRAHQTHPSHDDPTLFSGTSPLGFDGGSSGGWVEQHHHQDMGRFTRLMGWGGGSSSGGGNGTEGEERGGFLFNNQPQSLPPQALLLSQQGSATAYSQRGTLQSSFGPLLRALEDQRHHHHQQQQHHPSISNIGHGSDGFMGFYFPSQLPNELHGGASMSNRASSSSLSPDSSQHEMVTFHGKGESERCS